MQAARDPPNLKYERASPVPKMPDANPIQPSPSRFLVRLPSLLLQYIVACTPMPPPLFVAVKKSCIRAYQSPRAPDKI